MPSRGPAHQPLARTARRRLPSNNFARHCTRGCRISADECRRLTLTFLSRSILEPGSSSPEVGTSAASTTNSLGGQVLGGGLVVCRVRSCRLGSARSPLHQRDQRKRDIYSLQTRELLQFGGCRRPRSGQLGLATGHQSRKK